MAVNLKYSFNGRDLAAKKADRQTLDALIEQKKAEIADAKAKASGSEISEAASAFIIKQAVKAVVDAETAYCEKWKNELAPKFKRKQFLDVDPAEFSDCEIVNSNFTQHEPYTDVFPKGITGLVFRGCILDNCNIPEGAKLEDGSLNRQYMLQNDGEYWFVDENLDPISPKNYGKYDALGLSKDPADLPAAPMAEPITIAMDPEVIKQREIAALRADDARLEAALAAEKAG